MDVVPLLGAIVGCHCSALWLGGRVTANFGGVDVVPLQGAHGAMASRNSVQKNCLELLADLTPFSTLITQKLVFAIWGLCWYNSYRYLGKNVIIYVVAMMRPYAVLLFGLIELS